MIEQIISLNLTGTGYFEVAHSLARVCVGLFFGISGFHKLFHEGRHATLVHELHDSKIPFVPVMVWVVAGTEFLAGSALVIGFLTPLSALGLAAICLVACLTDGLQRMAAYDEINAADWFNTLLYLPEVPYLLLLGYLIASGGGIYSVDTVLKSLL